jgi:apolipoprotein N-acyltransferase
LVVIALVCLGTIAVLLNIMAGLRAHRPNPPVTITGIQLEFPNDYIVAKSLDHALKKYPDTQIFVLSEYTLVGAVPESLQKWCRDHGRFLVVGGKEEVTNEEYFNTAYIVGTNGDIVFRQGKSVPIQFFKDGLPAPKQSVWNSPWGKIGICICYDLSYTRVTDELIRQGAQLLIVPTMDVAEWGRHQHELHSRVAPIRAAEYGVPIFRLASSGISQAVTLNGQVVAYTAFPGSGELLHAQLRLTSRGALPWDRYLAPLCVAATATILSLLLWHTWREKPAKSAPKK